MTGYQEILTDPSYCKQIVTMTSPHIGNYGINEEDVESKKIQVSGFIIKEETLIPSNWRSVASIGDYLTKNKSWRKPNPNMIFKASKDFKIDLSKSILIGDRLSDITSGAKAGINNLYHVLTGHGSNERDLVIEKYCNSNNKLLVRLVLPA